jgi:hypothetical protein
LTGPSLPPVPEPPSFGPDPRQETFYGIVGRLTSALAEAGEVQVAATGTGFPASAVDLGRLQSEIEFALAGWSSPEVRARWREDVFPWLSRFTRAWVQRRSIFEARRTRTGIRLVLDTKDDRGHYHYVVEAFLNRRATRTRRRRSRG